MRRIAILQSMTRILCLFTVGFTILVSIYMAQPWGDNYAYQDIWGYLLLLGFILWACSPLLYLYYVSGGHDHSRSLVISRLLAALVVCIGGVLALVDTAFIHIDAQGGLIFIFLPIYQWIALLVIETIGRLIASRRTG